MTKATIVRIIVTKWNPFQEETNSGMVNYHTMTAMLGQYTMMVLSEQKTLTIVIYELPNTQGYRESCCSPAEFHHQRKELCIFIWWLPNNHSVLHNKPTSFITRMAFLGQKDRHVQWRQRVFFPGDSQVGVTGRMCRKVEP